MIKQFTPKLHLFSGNLGKKHCEIKPDVKLLKMFDKLYSELTAQQTF